MGVPCHRFFFQRTGFLFLFEWSPLIIGGKPFFFILPVVGAAHGGTLF